MRILLPARPPFSLSSVITSHGWMMLAPFETNEDYSILSYVYQLKSGRVISLDIIEEDQGVCVTGANKLTSSDQEEISKSVSWMLGLDQDFSDFYALTKHEPKLKHVEAKARGRILRSPTLFEDVVKTILSTNINWSGTIRMNTNLVSEFGKPFPGNDEKFTFPLASKLANVEEEIIRKKTGMGYRAPFVLELGQRVTSGELDLESYRTADIPKNRLHQELLSISGVGEYAASALLMLLGHYDTIPIDSWAKRFVSEEFYNGERIGKSEVEAVFEKWGDWKGLAYWFWGRSDPI